MGANRTVPAYPVVHGRCRHCGHKKPSWTPAQILRAAKEWNLERGRPPYADEWRNGTPSHPACSTVLTVFGSWNTMMEAAGFEPREQHLERKWTKARVIDAMLDWMALHGRWPTFRDWSKASEINPHAATVRDLFGSWNEARRAAGYTGKDRAWLRR